MQKVSKQSLAMIALSILLAISIALTFTFAVAQSTKTAKGTITFSGDKYVSLTSSGTDAVIGSEGNATITFAQTDFILTQQADGTVKAESKSSALDKIKQVKINFSNATGTKAAIAVTDTTGGTGNIIKLTIVTPTTTEVAAGASVTNLTLGDYISKLEVLNVTATEFTFTVKIALD